MKFNELNKDNFLLFAVKHYDNPRSATQEEFDRDLSRFKYIKRWFRKYHETGEVKTHLLLNHILVIFNCWGDAALPLFFYKVEPVYWSYMKSFFVYLDRLPEYPRSTIHDIEENLVILNKLRGIDV